jgi:hypothetical protein
LLYVISLQNLKQSVYKWNVPCSCHI